MPRAVAEVLPPPVAAKEAGLVYVSDDRPGIRRIRIGKGFKYLGPDGKIVRDGETLARIRSLVIPPAWEQVWICAKPSGHLQATGRDARGRKQHRYHPQFRRVREQNKYEKMIAFAKALPSIRRTTARHLCLPGLPRDKVLAAVVQLLEKTLIRVGNEEYAKTNNHYGLTTLQDNHAEIRGAQVRFHFTGKSGVRREVELSDARLANIVRACQDLPGQDLFQYIDDDGQKRDVTSGDVNDYLRQITGQEFTAKDFRTWAGTVLAATALAELKGFDSKVAAKRNVVAAVERVAKRLGNTTAVCRKCYIHPAILDSYMDGSMLRTIGQQAKALSRHGLKGDEARVLGLLTKRRKA